MSSLSIGMHAALILFFAWVLLHALMYSKSNGGVIEGLEGNSNGSDSNATPSKAPESMQTQIDENAAEIAVLKSQIASLINTSSQLNATMIQNEAGVKNNTDLIQKVVKSQNDTNSKLSNMKSAQ